jgi:hypothetical protein
MRVGIRLGPFHVSTRVGGRRNGRGAVGCLFAFVSLPLLAAIVGLLVVVVRGAQTITAKQWLLSGAAVSVLTALIVWLARTRWTHPIPPPQSGDECAASAPADPFTHASATHLCTLPVPHPAHVCACGHEWPVLGEEPSQVDAGRG